jgi:hypothetical protein
MLMLPSGEVLMSDDADHVLDIYTPFPIPASDSWRPVIHHITQNGNGVVTMIGTQLNGISQGAMWGDDQQAYSNYPLVQLVNEPFFQNAYLRTFNWSSTGVAEGNTLESVQFDIGPGDTLLHAIGDGIASATVLNIEMSPADNNITLQLDPNDPTLLQIFANTYNDEVPLSQFSSIIVSGAVNTNNSLTVDYGAGGFFTTFVQFDGGSGGSNALTVTDAPDSNPQSWSVGFASLGATGTGLSSNPGVGYRGVQAVTLDTGSGGGQVAVNSTSPGVITNVVAAGNTTVTVGFGTCFFIQGMVNIENPTGHNTLVVDNSADPNYHVVTIGTFINQQYDSQHSATDNWGYIHGLCQGDINYEDPELRKMTLKAGKNVLIDMLASLSVANIVGDGLLGMSMGVGGSLHGIEAAVNLTNSQPGGTTLSLDDSADLARQTVTLTTTQPVAGGPPLGSITGLAPAAITYDYAGTASVTIATSMASGDVLNVLGTGVLTNLHPPNPCIVNVGRGSVQGILGPVNIVDGQAGSASVLVDDSADDTQENVTLSTFTPSDSNSPWGAILIGLLHPINYEFAATKNVVLKESRGNDTAWVANLPQVPVKLLGGTGTDTLNGPDAVPNT